MTEEETKSLASDIPKNGLEDPIVTMLKQGVKTL
jgi:hypothetical protein